MYPWELTPIKLLKNSLLPEVVLQQSKARGASPSHALLLQRTESVLHTGKNQHSTQCFLEWGLEHMTTAINQN